MPYWQEKINLGRKNQNWMFKNSIEIFQGLIEFIKGLIARKWFLSSIWALIRRNWSLELNRNFKKLI